MSPRRQAGVTCPRCHTFCYELSNGTLSEHKTDRILPGQPPRRAVRERCVYSGGTWIDAKLRITPLQRQVLDRNSFRNAP